MQIQEGLSFVLICHCIVPKHVGSANVSYCCFCVWFCASVCIPIFTLTAISN